MLHLMRAKRFRIGWQDGIEREVTPEEADKKLSALIEQGVVSQTQGRGQRGDVAHVDERYPAAGIPRSGSHPQIVEAVGTIHRRGSHIPCAVGYGQRARTGKAGFRF